MQEIMINFLLIEFQLLYLKPNNIVVEKNKTNNDYWYTKFVNALHTCW